MEGHLVGGDEDGWAPAAGEVVAKGRGKLGHPTDSG